MTCNGCKDLDACPSPEKCICGGRGWYIHPYSDDPWNPDDREVYCSCPENRKARERDGEKAPP